MSQDSLWIDDFFDSVDLVIIPEYSFNYTDISIDYFEGKKVNLLNSYLETDITEHILSKKIDLKQLQGGRITVGLKSKKIDAFISYFLTWNQFMDYSYDSPYYSAKNKKIGEAQLTTGELQIYSHYWFTDVIGVGLEYNMFGSNLEIVNILDDSNGLYSQSIANFNISHHLAYLYAPIKYKYSNYNINVLFAFSIFTIKNNSSTFIEINPQFSKGFITPFGFKIQLGVNKKLFNLLPFGIKYKFNYLSSKGEYSYMTNTISLQIGIPQF